MNKNVFLNSKVLITGHTGFKGSWLSLWLSSLGANVIGASIDVPTNPSHFNASCLSNIINDHRLDIRDFDSLKRLIESESPDFIFHLAAQPLVRQSYLNPIDTWETNTIGTIKLLEALRSLKKPCVAILITSDKCYDNVEWVWGYRESDALGGADPYSASKGAAELAIRSYVKSYFPSDGMVRIGIGRAGNVIGGGDWAQDRIVPDCMRAWSIGEVVYLRNPLATRPWQFVLEPLSGYLELASTLYGNATMHGEPFNFGPQAQNDYSVGSLVASMSKHWDKVRWEVVLAKDISPYESNLLKLNCDKALHLLKWHAIYDFETTVRETTLWYQHYYESSQKSTKKLSIGQIEAYTLAAKNRGLKWAQ